MHNPQHRLLISNHHGDVNAPNELEAAKRVELTHGHEIDIYEIDFVSYYGRIVSAHDYDIDKIARGSDLHEWIDFVVVQRRKVLWLDVKENLDIYLACGFAKFDAQALFDTLAYKRAQVLNQHRERDGDGGSKKPLDIANYIIIGCQESELRADLVFRNRLQQHGFRWHMILDAPDVWSYVLQYLCPALLKPYLRDFVCNEFQQNSEYHHYGVISVDQSFFASRRDITAFIESLRLAPNTLVIINSFARDVAPIAIANHYIIMQYDYTCLQQQ